MKGLIKKHRALLIFVLLLGDAPKWAFSAVKCKKSDWAEGGYDTLSKMGCSEEGQKCLRIEFDEFECGIVRGIVSYFRRLV